MSNNPNLNRNTMLNQNKATRKKSLFYNKQKSENIPIESEANPFSQNQTKKNIYQNNDFNQINKAPPSRRYTISAFPFPKDTPFDTSMENNSLNIQPNSKINKVTKIQPKKQKLNNKITIEKKFNNKDAMSEKLTKMGNNKQKSKSPSKNQSNSKNKNLSNSKSKNNIKILKTSANANNMSEIASKMEETNKKRKKRLEQEKKEEARDKKVYEQVLKEFQEKNKARAITEVNARKRLTSPKNKNDEIDNIKLPKIRISEKKTQFLLEENGMLDAYKYLIIQLCKNGLPTGNLFEYSAYVIRNYEKKWKEKK